MIRLIVSRVLQTPLIVLAVYTITFLLAWSLPGSAVLNDEGRQPPQAVLEAIERQYNLDDQWAFYTEYLSEASGLAYLRERLGGRAHAEAAPVFDFGPSLRHQDWSVNEILGATLPVSVTLGLLAILLALGIGLGAGIIGALRPGSPTDLATLGIALIGVSLPSFVTAAALLIVFPVWLGVGRVGRWGGPLDMLLPALALSLPFAAYIARLTRMGMIEQLSADYVRTARAKGVSERDVVLRHALRNAFLPVMSYLGPATAFAMTGSFVVEMVFNVPGLGQHFVDAVLTKDLFLIMGVVLIYSTLLILMNLAADVLAAALDPRLRDG